MGDTVYTTCVKLLKYLCCIKSRRIKEGAVGGERGTPGARNKILGLNLGVSCKCTPKGKSTPSD